MGIRLVQPISAIGCTSHQFLPTAEEPASRERGDAGQGSPGGSAGERSAWPHQAANEIWLLLVDLGRVGSQCAGS